METDIMRIRKDLEEFARGQGIPLFGVADLVPVRDYIGETYGDELLHLPRAISMGLPYPAGVVNQLADAPSHTYLYYYKVLNTRLDDLALLLANRLQEAGYEAFPIPASQRVTEDRLAGIFSHRLAAALSGLGWIGRNSSLISPEYGPRLRLVTVLTDCPLPEDRPMESRCGVCRACEEACPSGAITGEEFCPEDPLEKRFLGYLCDEHLSRVRSTFGKRICGKCLSACPWGERKKRHHDQEKK